MCTLLLTKILTLPSTVPANFHLRGSEEKEEKKKKKMKEKRKKRKKKEDFLNDEYEELTYPFSLLLEFSFGWT